MSILKTRSLAAATNNNFQPGALELCPFIGIRFVCLLFVSWDKLERLVLFVNHPELSRLWVICIWLCFSSDITNVWTSYVWYCILASNMFKWYSFGQIMIGPLGFFLPDNIISVSSNTACERGGKVQVVFDEFKLSRSSHRKWLWWTLSQDWVSPYSCKLVNYQTAHSALVEVI